MRAIVNALNSKVGFELVNSDEEEGQIRLLGRIPQSKAQLVHQGHDCLVVTLHDISAKEGWSLDISKLYFKSVDHAVYAWRFIFSGEGEGWQDLVAKAILSVRLTQEMEEVRIHGARPGRLNTVANKGKGAKPTAPNTR